MHTKKVFVMKNFKSPYIEQAIFILREDAKENDGAFHAAEEAERIVEAYLASDGAALPNEKKHARLAPKLFAFLAAAGLFIFLLGKIVTFF